MRGLLDRDAALRFADQIDRAFAERQKLARGEPPAEGYYEEFQAQSPFEIAEGARMWVMEGGGVLAPDAPMLTYEMLEMFDAAGLPKLVGDYLGEPPMISLQKTTLRKAEPHVGGAWHQDGAFMGDVRALNLWVSLSRCGDESPGLDIVPRRLDDIVATTTEEAVSRLPSVPGQSRGGRRGQEDRAGPSSSRATRSSSTSCSCTPPARTPRCRSRAMRSRAGSSEARPSRRSTVRSPSKQERIEALAPLLHHPDPSQLWFQVAEIAGEQTYLRHGVEVNEGDVVLDVGGNVGVAAAFFASHCRAGLVHSFEPVGPICSVLRENLAGLSACVVHELGLSSSPGQAEITYYPGAAAMSGLYADARRDRALVRTALLNRGLSGPEADEQLEGRYEGETLTCRLTTLADFLAGEGLERVDLLKIDVERAELDVLAGIGEADWARIAQLVVEVHDEDGRCAEVETSLSGRGFQVTSEQDEAMRGTAVRMVYARRP